MLGYEVLSYLLCSGPLETTHKALGCDLMLISYMPFDFLGSFIAFVATIVMAGPLLGYLHPFLGTLGNFNFWDQLKVAKP